MSNTSDCCICHPSDSETRLIEDALFQKLISEKQGLKFGDEVIEEITEQSQGFIRLLRMLFNKKYSNLKSTKLCKHIFLKKQFASKLKCNGKMLDYLSTSISNRIAKYNYHIDVISNQTKTFIRHFFQDKASTPPKHKKIIEKQSTEKRTQKMEPNILNKPQETENVFKAENRKPQSLKLATYNPYLTSFVQFPSAFSTLFPSMNFPLGFPFPSEQLPQNQSSQRE